MLISFWYSSMFLCCCISTLLFFKSLEKYVIFWCNIKHTNFICIFLISLDFFSEHLFLYIYILIISLRGLEINVQKYSYLYIFKYLMQVKLNFDVFFFKFRPPPPTAILLTIHWPRHFKFRHLKKWRITGGAPLWWL